MSFWVILLLIVIGFLFGFAFGGFLYSKSVEAVSDDHVEAVKHVTRSYDERARQVREANNSVLSYVTGGEFEPGGMLEKGSAERAGLGQLVLVSGVDYVPSRGEVDDEGVVSTVSFKGVRELESAPQEDEDVVSHDTGVVLDQVAPREDESVGVSRRWVPKESVVEPVEASEETVVEDGKSESGEPGLIGVIEVEDLLDNGSLDELGEK